MSSKICNRMQTSNGTHGQAEKFWREKEKESETIEWQRDETQIDKYLRFSFGRIGDRIVFSVVHAGFCFGPFLVCSNFDGRRDICDLLRALNTKQCQQQQPGQSGKLIGTVFVCYRFPFYPERIKFSAHKTVDQKAKQSKRKKGTRIRRGVLCIVRVLL